MEIREGIKYKTSYGELAEIFAHSKVHNFYAKFFRGGISTNYTSKEWIEDFKSGKLQLVEYPYKVGDWIVIIKNEAGDYENTVVQIIGFNSDNTAINYNSIRKPGMYYGAIFEAIRPAFKEEISKSKQEKVIKENYDYLIPILTELNK